MKKVFRTLTIMAIMALSAASCQKVPSDFERVPATRQVQYIVEETAYSAVLSNDDDWDLFLDNIFALAKEGYSVMIRGNMGRTSVEKKTVTFTTTSESEAKKWVKERLSEGYSVSVDYDKTTGVFTCIATI